jgi:hypothetical protein
MNRPRPPAGVHPPRLITAERLRSEICQIKQPREAVIKPSAPIFRLLEPTEQCFTIHWQAEGPSAHNGGEVIS